MKQVQSKKGHRFCSLSLTVVGLSDLWRSNALLKTNQGAEISMRDWAGSISLEESENHQILNQAFPWFESRTPPGGSSNEWNRVSAISGHPLSNGAGNESSQKVCLILEFQQHQRIARCKPYGQMATSTSEAKDFLPLTHTQGRVLIIRGEFARAIDGSGM